LQALLLQQGLSSFLKEQDMNDLIYIILSIAVTGFLVWAILQIPMPQIFRNIILGVVALALVIWIVQYAGLTLPAMHSRPLVR
jgi:uncharacterized protein with PQ loop repeat